MKNLLVGALTVATCLAIVGQPVQANSTIESLPNGNHQLCEGYPSTADLTFCFGFTKRGNRVVGGLGFVGNYDLSICIDGVVNNNTVSGQAVKYGRYSYIDLTDYYVPEYIGTTLRDLEEYRGRLKVARVIIVTSRIAHFRSALLNLNDLTRYDLDVDGNWSPDACFSGFPGYPMDSL